MNIFTVRPLPTAIQRRSGQQAKSTASLIGKLIKNHVICFSWRDVCMILYVLYDLHGVA